MKEAISQGITIEINTEQVDEAIEKANRLVELLKEAEQIIDSLTGGQKVKKYKEVAFSGSVDVDQILSSVTKALDKIE